jgi:hypothetical protein
MVVGWRKGRLRLKAAAVSGRSNRYAGFVCFVGVDVWVMLTADRLNLSLSRPRQEVERRDISLLVLVWVVSERTT